LHLISRKPWLRVLGLVFALCGVTASVWTALVYVELIRLEAAAVDSCARVETASRIRLELVENLVAGARRSIGDEGAARLGQASRRVSEIVITPETLDDEAGYRAYRRAQAELSSVLNAVWSGRAGSGAPPAGTAVDDLRPEIERWSSLLEQGLAAMERQVDSYRASAQGFPGSWIAGALRAGETPAAMQRTAADRAHVSAAGSRATR